MDLSKLIAKSKIASITTPNGVKQIPGPSKPEGIVESLNEIDKILVESKHVANCMCGHPKDAHDDESGDCAILECECISYYPPSQVPTAENLLAEELSIEERLAAVAEQKEARKGILEVPKLTKPFKIPAGTYIQVDSTPQAPVEDEWDNDMSKCHHLCECGKWWSHGPIDKCRYPDLVSQGKCFTCLNGGTNPSPLEDFENGKFSIKAEIVVRNRQRDICKDMNIEQLTHHIAFLAKEIETLRVKSLETRKMREALEEEELADIPENEREKFLQELRNGAAKEKKPRKARVTKSKETPDSNGVRISAYEKNVQNLMRRMNKSREDIERFLND